MIKIYCGKYHVHTSTYARYIKRSTYINILLYKLTVTDKVLDKYLQQQYGLSLIDCCIKLLHGCHINYIDADHCYIVTFLSPNLNKLALLIANGNLEVNGSGVLRKVFAPIS